MWIMTYGMFCAKCLMVCFVPSVCLSIRKSCERRDCSELGNIRNWVEHCTIINIKKNRSKLSQICSYPIFPGDSRTSSTQPW